MTFIDINGNISDCNKKKCTYLSCKGYKSLAPDFVFREDSDNISFLYREIQNVDSYDCFEIPYDLSVYDSISPVPCSQISDSNRPSYFTLRNPGCFSTIDKQDYVAELLIGKEIERSCCVKQRCQSCRWDVNVISVTYQIECDRLYPAIYCSSNLQMPTTSCDRELRVDSLCLQYVAFSETVPPPKCRNSFDIDPITPDKWSIVGDTEYLRFYSLENDDCECECQQCIKCDEPSICKPLPSTSDYFYTNITRENLDDFQQHTRCAGGGYPIICPNQTCFSDYSNRYDTTWSRICCSQSTEDLSFCTEIRDTETKRNPNDYCEIDSGCQQIPKRQRPDTFCTYGYKYCEAHDLIHKYKYRIYSAEKKFYETCYGCANNCQEECPSATYKKNNLGKLEYQLLEEFIETTTIIVTDFFCEATLEDYDC